jgi:hypothetical protein
VWVPDAGHEAMRDLVRTRLDAVHAVPHGTNPWAEGSRLTGLRFAQAAHRNECSASSPDALDVSRAPMRDGAIRIGYDSLARTIVLSIVIWVLTVDVNCGCT